MVRTIVRSSVTSYVMVNKRACTRGFTLIELVAVMGIFVVITSIVLVNNNQFGGKFLLENLAYDVALSVRTAQVYGTSVKRSDAGVFTNGYGIHFDAASPSSYVLFADAVANGLYDSSSGELVQSYSFQSGYTISSLCTTLGSASTEACGSSALDIQFQRPEPGARISGNGISGVTNPAYLQSRGRIVLRSPRGDQISIVVESTGQISVQ